MEFYVVNAHGQKCASAIYHQMTQQENGVDFILQELENPVKYLLLL
jgi:hypothetical protein